MAKRKTRRRRRNPARSYRYKGAGTAWRLNPHRKKRRRRRNAGAAGPRAYRKVITNPKRKPRRKNPARKKLTLRNIFSEQRLQDYAWTGSGFLGGYVAMPYIADAATKMLPRSRNFLGLIHLTLGAIVAVRARKSGSKAFGAGVAISGFYDLVASNLKIDGQNVFMPLPSSPSAVPGLPSMGESVSADYGYRNMRSRPVLSSTYQPGTDVVGSTYQPGTEVVGSNYQPGTEVVGSEFGFSGLDEEDSGMGMMDY